jgi:hypothetical protein
LLVRVFLQLFHVRPDQHLSQLDEIAVFLVVDFDRSPWIRTSSDLTTIWSGDDGIGSNDCEGNFAL